MRTMKASLLASALELERGCSVPVAKCGQPTQWAVFFLTVGATW